MGPIRLAKLAIRAAIALAGIAALYVGVTFGQVWWDSRQNDATQSDAIVVLGAAQYDGTPSPVLRARLDHALELYNQGLAPIVIVTGGKQKGDRFTEAFSGYDYLREHGVTEEALHLEVEGSDTYSQLSASHLIMENTGLTSALLVSDPYHSKRLQAIASEVGIEEVYVSPTGTATTTADLVRETAAVSIGRIVGYRRLGNWLS